MPKPHDIIALEVERFIRSRPSAPVWVEESLLETPFVVCRRGPPLAGKIAIGVRGIARDQRWPGTCATEFLGKSISPHDLTSRVPDSIRTAEIPALQAFELLKKRWAGCGVLWGPGGSVGFELATGRVTVTHESDLDIIVRAPTAIPKEQAAFLCNESGGLACTVDIRVETPFSSFSLREYASTSRILIRLPERSLLGVDPWDAQLRAEATS